MGRRDIFTKEQTWGTWKKLFLAAAAGLCYAVVFFAVRKIVFAFTDSKLLLNLLSAALPAAMQLLFAAFYRTGTKGRYARLFSWFSRFAAGFMRRRLCLSAHIWSTETTIFSFICMG